MRVGASVQAAEEPDAAVGSPIVWITVPVGGGDLHHFGAHRSGAHRGAAVAAADQQDAARRERRRGARREREREREQAHAI